MSAVISLVLGIPPGDSLMASIVAQLEAAGVSVELVELDPTGDDPQNRDRFRHRLDGRSSVSIIGGFSLGARIAASLCPEVGPRALLAFGYPFHRANDAESGGGLEALRQVSVPTMIVQGTRDPHGSKPEVEGYALCDNVALGWLPDGNNRYVPRARSGHTLDGHVSAAAKFAISFLRSH
jgi:predicted alpha/beta-hydrolase family hydrolase